MLLAYMHIHMSYLNMICQRLWSIFFLGSVASMGNFLHHLDPDMRKIRLERLHLKILKKYA